MKGSMHSGVGAARGPDSAGRQEPLVAVLRLEVGATVSATVLELLGQGRVLVGLRGFKVEARSEVPLEPGSRHLFTVVEAGETVRLALGRGSEPAGAVDPGEALLARLLARAGSLALPGLLARLLEGIQGQGRDALCALLERLCQRPEGALDLRKLVRGLGLDLEAALARAARSGQELPPETAHSLKALLLGEAARPGLPLPGLEATLAALEGLQGENLHLARLGGGLLVPLPLFPGLTGGEIRFLPPSPPEEQGQEPGTRGAGRPFRVLLLLDLERMGPVRVAVESLGRQLGILFECGWPETLGLVKSQLPDLRASLEAIGLRPMTLEAQPVRFAERDRERSTTIDRLDAGGLVDVEG